ncbi:MAG: response regulator, partial [Thiovulaceae bacterium]|nr:response regulator [Sulfurimonadaceae bacterium]
MSNIKDLFELTKELSLLYVEDDKVLQEEMANVFKDLFKKVYTADDGVKGLELYQNFHEKNGHHFDLVITDINMPHMNGIELCENITGINQDQVIIVVSAHNESEYLFKLINLGITYFILKPVNMDKLINILKKTAKVIQTDQRARLEQEKILSENSDLTMANEELEQQVRAEMY